MSDFRVCRCGHYVGAHFPRCSYCGCEGVDVKGKSCDNLIVKGARWVWLLLLPWVVVVSTEPRPPWCDGVTNDEPDSIVCRSYPKVKKVVQYYAYEVFNCVPDASTGRNACIWMDDFVWGMNAAHADRQCAELGGCEASPEEPSPPEEGTDK